MFVSDVDPLRRCARCGERKALQAFAFRRRALNELDTYGRPCRSAYGKEHYARNRQRYIDHAATQKSRLADERTAYLLEFFATHPCSDCGESDPVVLQFDHLGDKEFNIGAHLVRRPWRTILEEIAK